VRLVDHDDVVLGEHLETFEGVDGEHRVVGDDDVGLARFGAGPFGEAVDADRALGHAEALAGGDGDLLPGLFGDAGDQFVAVTGLGLRGPLVEALHLTAQAGDREGVEEGALVRFIRGAGVQAVHAQVVAAALEDGEVGFAAQFLLEGLGEAGEVAVHELPLEGDGGRGDHDGGFLGHGVAQGGDEVGQGLAGAGARLDGQVLAGADGVVHRLRHLHLALALGSAHRIHGGG
jgi:hypothetical protein